MAQDLLSRILRPAPAPFALLHRPGTNGSDILEILTGEASTVDTLAQIPLPDLEDAAGARQDVLVVIPYRQVAERGYACVDDGEPLTVMTVAEQATIPVAEALRRLPDEPVRLSGGRFEQDDDAYADLVRKVIADEIGTGEGANFVIKRTFVADITDYTVRSALGFFRRLLEREQGAYWTFVVHTGDRTFVGATPERHVSLSAGRAVMNPISGTYRYPPSGPTLDGVMDFLADRKEADELYMVVDEELKMMARLCDPGPRVVGPYLKQMARLAHTEYFIEGDTDHDPRTILRETMFAPTVTGSPLESACKVIRRYEPEGRGYYSGAVALIGRDEHGGRTLDSSILIRTADIDNAGRLRIGVGATLVRHSDPESEVAETHAKAAGLLAALNTSGAARLAEHPRVREALAERNGTIAGFWLSERDAGPSSGVLTGGGRQLMGRRVLVVDAEDTFTSMIDHQLRSMGLEPTVRRFDERYSFDGHDLVIMGPGPGDPRAVTHPKIAHLRSAIRQLLDEQKPFLAVCLSHQVLSTLLGLELARRPVPNQGVQREIDLFGARERVGFYNTFAARCQEDKFEAPGLGAGVGIGVVEVSRDHDTGEVHALRGPGFASMQFHAESVLTQDGVRIVSDALTGVLQSCER
ncbi:phenazine-specific anthranilate synthase component I [Streptomyces turgidiscabies]|uniref:anthranilate synthase n=1 Tax=Streptomyces turgidiscabies (strain Car8) TaxID=698760 RepID=L7F9M2_STRT8|nr:MULTISPECIES: phenazine-specific anthranilate synthase component I [Streptomyces]ELP67814.1 chorismate binding enzyme [Streptomyces turgidiscabies Car8]MDX3494270.1 phenazine-specific anthranilate synthase component I [Streptomyces turgidiscabies]